MSFRLLIKVVALASTCWLSVSQAWAENRIALVIGNSSYKSVTALPNPANDAKAMTRFLASAGFQVLQAPDLTQSDMRRTFGNFASLVAEKGPDTVALVFYAGHGLQVDGENYLVPVDASIQREADVPLQAMRLADLMNALASVSAKTKLVILDACRNNPFSEINKTTGRGLAIVDAPSGSLVSYSTAPGTEAQDGDGANSPYTAALIKIASEPGLPIEQALKRVRLAVNDATAKQQTPWESSSLTSEFAFVAPNGKQQPKVASAGQPAGGPAVSGAAGRSETRSVDAWQKELKGKTAKEAYETVIREDKVEAYQAYLALYPNQSAASAVRSIVERRQVMVAWYEAVTVNTPVAFQTFLAAYGSSDFAFTANRLLDRMRTRSVQNATSAFASANACPCSQPNSAPKVLPRRTDAAPSGTGNGPTSGGPTTVAVSDPVVTPVYDPPVRIRVRDDWPRRRVHDDWPRGGDKGNKGGDKPKHDGKPSRIGGDGKPPRTVGDGKPPRTVGNIPTRPIYMVKQRPIMTTTSRPVMMNRSMGMGPRPAFRMGMGPRPAFRMGGFGGRRMF
jgi:uncharacterized caspase-like protein